jgi:hypothetical protein
MKVAFGLYMADHDFDVGAASQLSLDDTEHAALLPRDEDAVRVRRIVAAVSFVEIGTLNLAASEPLGAVDGGAQRAKGLPGSALACTTNWPPSTRGQRPSH